jgi:hypothetical protein
MTHLFHVKYAPCGILNGPPQVDSVEVLVVSCES